MRGNVPDGNTINFACHLLGQKLLFLKFWIRRDGLKKSGHVRHDRKGSDLCSSVTAGTADYGTIGTSTAAPSRADVFDRLKFRHVLRQMLRTYDGVQC